MTTESVIQEVLAERKRQDAKWGEQNHPSHFPGLSSSEDYVLHSESEAKSNCNQAFSAGNGNWSDIHIEELCEVLSAPNDSARRFELIQLAATCIAEVECIDRRYQ